MRYILDTHAAIWFITDNNKLPADSKKRIEDPDNECLVSAASLWEIAIKHSLGKLDLKLTLRDVFNLIEQSHLHMLSITSEHILAISDLPFHHRDPFDRMIIGQGRIEKARIITKDAHFSRYGIETVW